MAKMQAGKMQTGEDRGDGLREKMVAINRVTKVVKGGRVMGFAALTPAEMREAVVKLEKVLAGLVTSRDTTLKTSRTNA